MKRFLLATTFAALPMMASAAEYVCDTTNFGRGGWVPDRIYLAFDVTSGQAFAYDGAIATVSEAPIPVELKKRSDTSYQFRWAVDLKASNGGRSKSSYRVILYTDRNKFVLSGRRHGYDNIISGEGTCKKVG